VAAHYSVLYPTLLSGGILSLGVCLGMGQSVWIITTNGKRDIRAIAKDLAAAGLSVTQNFSAIPCITGRAGKSSIAKIKKVKGVVDVAPDVPVRIGPPGKKLTWWLLRICSR